MGPSGTEENFGPVCIIILKMNQMDFRGLQIMRSKEEGPDDPKFFLMFSLNKHVKLNICGSRCRGSYNSSQWTLFRQAKKFLPWG